MPYHLRTLGRLSLHPDAPDASPVLSDSKSLALLAYLAAAPGRRARRSHLAALLWPHSDRDRARASLRQALYYLSRKAGDRLTLSDDGVVAPDTRKLSVDLWSFDRALEEDEWERAVELYGGPFLGDYDVRGAREFEGWREAQNERVWGGLKAAYYRIVEQATDTGDLEKAVRYARDYVGLNPLDETAQRTLIRAQLAAGDRVGAYRSYERYRSLLREELGEEPGEELEARVEELRDRLFEAPVADVPDGPAVAGGPGGSGSEPDGSRGVGTAGVGSGAAGGGGDVGAGGGPEETESVAERLLPSGPVRPGALTAAMVAGVLLGALLGSALVTMLDGAGGGRASGGDGTWTGAEGRLLAVTAGNERREVVIREGHARVRPTDLAGRVHPSPDGDRLLRVLRTPGGADLAVTDAESGDTVRVVADGQPDEAPLAWGPSGRRVLYWEGERVRGDRGFVRHLRIANLETGDVRAVEGAPDLGAPIRTVASWSPLGPWIAFQGEDESAEADIYVARADGGGLRRLTPDRGEERHPAWSPDGRRLAYTALGDEGADGDLSVIGVDGDGREMLTRGSTDDRHPEWLSSRHVAFLSDRGGGTDVWLMDLQTRKLRRLTSDGDYDALRALDVPARSAPLRRLRIVPRYDTVSPGQHLRLDARAWTAGGNTVPSDLVPLAWGATDTSVVRVRGDSTARVLRAGSARLVADAGGWTADTLLLASRPLVARRPELAFRERWSDGISSDRWTVFGSPEPYVTEAADATLASSGTPRTARAFVNNGDANYSSGVVSRPEFDLEGARTVEFRAALPFTRRHYQGVVVGLAARGPETAGESWARADAEKIALRFGGNPRGAHAAVTAPEGRWRVPLPSEAGDWHRYALQVDDDGRVAYVVDGRLLWRSPTPVVGPLRGRRLRLLLGGRSLHTELMVGEIRVWRGVRFGYAPHPELVSGEGGAGRERAKPDLRGGGDALRPRP